MKKNKSSWKAAQKKTKNRPTPLGSSYTQHHPLLLHSSFSRSSNPTLKHTYTHAWTKVEKKGIKRAFPKFWLHGLIVSCCSCCWVSSITSDLCLFPSVYVCLYLGMSETLTVEFVVYEVKIEVLLSSISIMAVVSLFVCFWMIQHVYHILDSISSKFYLCKINSCSGRLW